jgi:hypothetical protein
LLTPAPMDSLNTCLSVNAHTTELILAEC